MSPHVHHLVVWCVTVFDAFLQRRCRRTVASVVQKYGQIIKLLSKCLLRNATKKQVRSEARTHTHMHTYTHTRFLPKNMRFFEIGRNFVELVCSKGPKTFVGDVMMRGVANNFTRAHSFITIAGEIKMGGGPRGNGFYEMMRRVTNHFTRFQIKV